MYCLPFYVTFFSLSSPNSFLLLSYASGTVLKINACPSDELRLSNYSVGKSNLYTINSPCLRQEFRQVQQEKTWSGISEKGVRRYCVDRLWLQALQGTSSVYIVSLLISPHLGIGAGIKEANSPHQEPLQEGNFAWIFGGCYPYLIRKRSVWWNSLIW